MVYDKETVLKKLKDCLGFTNNKKEIVIKDNKIKALNKALISIPFETDIDCVVDASLLIKMIASIKGETVTIKQSEGALKITSDNTELDVPCIDSMIKLDNVYDETRFITMTEDFQEVVHKLSDTVKEGFAEKNYSYCIKIEEDKIYTIDSRQVAYLTTENAVGSNFILSRELALLATKFGIESYYITDKASIVFKTLEGYTIEVPQADYNLPKMSEKILLEDGVDFELPEDIEDVVNRILSVHKDGNNYYIEMNFTENGMTIKYKSSNSVVINEVFRGVYPVDKILINPTHLFMDRD